MAVLAIGLLGTCAIVLAISRTIAPRTASEPTR
jgi:hypothetical protein